MIGSELTLLTTVTSNFLRVKKKVEYGKAGEKVRVISVHGEVAIVESNNGERFPTKIENLK